MFEMTKRAVGKMRCFQGLSVYLSVVSSSFNLIIRLLILLTFIKTSDYTENLNFH